MTSETVNDFAAGKDSLSFELNGFGSRAPATPLERWFCDRVGQLRRPMLLLVVVALDAGLMAVAGAIAYALSSPQSLTNLPTTIAILALPWLVIGVLSAKWSYSVAALRRPASQIGKILAAVTIVTLSANGILYLSGSQAVAPETAIVWAALAVLFLAANRILAGRLIQQFAQAGRLRRRAVIVGGGADAEALVEMLREESTHLAILGMFDDRSANRNNLAGDDKSLRRLGTFDELSEFCRETGVELLIVSVPAAAEDRILQIAQQAAYSCRSTFAFRPTTPSCASTAAPIPTSARSRCCPYSIAL